VLHGSGLKAEALNKIGLKVVGQGDTQDDALAGLQETVAGYLECADPAEVTARMHSRMQIRTSDVAD